MIQNEFYKNILRFFIFIAGYALCAVGVSQAAVQDKPNIIVIIADDLGYGDLGSYGQSKIRTPVLDDMAAHGLSFRQFYAGAPVCAPSRNTLMTGQTNGHTSIRGNCETELPTTPVSLKDEDVTLAEVLKPQGYVSAAIGKWALGLESSQGHPLRQGFDRFFGYLDQRDAHHHYPQWLWDNYEKVYFTDNQGATGQQFSDDLFIKQAVDFMEGHADRPFFLYLALTSPHADIVAPSEAMAQYRGAFEETPYAGGEYSPQPQPRAAYAAMVSHIDAQVGKVRDKLRSLGIEDQTLILFTSDNGPASAGGRDIDFFRSRGPFHGEKFGLQEGGIRIPMIAYWPAKIKYPSVDEQHVLAFWDILPTLADLIGATVPPAADGVSFAPLLTSAPLSLPERMLYWEFHGRDFEQAVRFQNWKGLRSGAKAPLSLYDLAQDITETHNIADQNHEVVRKLETFLNQARRPASLWPAKCGNRWYQKLDRFCSECLPASLRVRLDEWFDNQDCQ